MLKRQIMAVVGACALSIGFAAPAQAAPGGNTAGDSLVNVQVGDVTALVPVAVAANLCDINANVLANQVRKGDTTCTATAESLASPGDGHGNGHSGGNTAGDSLVNVQVGDVTLLVPVAVAANLCDINVNVLANQVRDGDTTCKATAESLASPGSGNGQGGGNAAGDSLVNVQIGDVTVALPIAIAANVCDINVNVLANQVRNGDTTCTASSSAKVKKD